MVPEEQLESISGFHMHAHIHAPTTHTYTGPSAHTNTLTIDIELIYENNPFFQVKRKCRGLDVITKQHKLSFFKNKT